MIGRHQTSAQPPAAIAIVGSDPAAPGGISRVIQLTLKSPLAACWRLIMVPTWVEGSSRKRACAYLGSLAQIWWMAAAGRLQAVHLHMAARGSFWRKWLIGMPLTRSGVRVIVHIHDGTLASWHAAQHPWTKALFRRFVENADAVIALSPTWRQALAPLAPKARWLVVCNPVAIPRSTAFSAPSPSDGSLVASPSDAAGKTILFLGRLREEKGLEELLSAAVELARIRPADRWLLGGDGDIAAVGRRLAELGLTQTVQLLGWLNEEQKSRALSSADLLALPSHAEGQPLAVLEAMAWGIPVVATDVGDIPHLLACGAGISVPPGDPPALSAAVLRVLQDPELSQQMGACGRRHALEHHSVERVAFELDALYRRLGLVPTAGPLLPPRQVGG